MQRAAVVNLREGANWSFIEIANHLGRSLRTVKYIWTKYLADGDYKKAKRRRHHRITTPEEDDRIYRLSAENPSMTSKAIVDELNLLATSSTVRRRLINVDLKSHIMARKECLLPRHIDERLQYAYGHIFREEEFWRKVIFVDEKYWDISKSCRRRIRRHTSTR